MSIYLVKQNDGTCMGWKNINVFYSTFTNVFFYFCHVFLRFLTFFLFCQGFLFLKTFIENTIWNHFRNNGNKSGLYIFFLCAHVRISISTYILTSIVTYLPYRLTSSDVTRLADKLQDTTYLESNLSYGLVNLRQMTMIVIMTLDSQWLILSVRFTD